MANCDGIQVLRERSSQLSLDQLTVGTRRALPLRRSLSADLTLGTKENTVCNFAFPEGPNVMEHKHSEFQRQD